VWSDGITSLVRRVGPASWHGPDNWGSPSHAPLSGVLSEGEKRDSKGDMSESPSLSHVISQQES
jgi:hypothetical protein